jgi:hypothetical protein
MLNEYVSFISSAESTLSPTGSHVFCSVFAGSAPHPSVGPLRPLLLVFLHRLAALPEEVRRPHKEVEREQLRDGHHEEMMD